MAFAYKWAGLLLCCCAASVMAQAQLKKGVGLTESAGLGDRHLQDLQVAWYYNWGPQSAVQSSAQFVPMVFSARSIRADSQTLKLLSPGDRVWVKIPQTGFVGVGEVTESVQSAKDFTVPTPEGDRSALDVLQHGPLYRATADDPEQAEYFVRVKWLHAVDAAHAFNEVGLFGNQNTVCQPRAAKWRHTVERLKAVFVNWNSPSQS